MVNIYELLNRIIVNKRYSLSPNLFIEADRTELSEEERSIFDLLKNIVSLGTKIHNDGIEFHPMFVMADGSRTFSIEDISEDDYLILHSLKLEKMPLILRALLADILWTNKKEFNAAKIAANAYWELFTLWYRDDDNVGTIDIIRRAVCISAQTKQTLLFEKIYTYKGSSTPWQIDSVNNITFKGVGQAGFQKPSGNAGRFGFIRHCNNLKFLNPC